MKVKTVDDFAKYFFRFLRLFFIQSQRKNYLENVKAC